MRAPTPGEAGPTQLHHTCEGKLSGPSAASCELCTIRNAVVISMTEDMINQHMLMSYCKPKGESFHSRELPGRTRASGRIDMEALSADAKITLCEDASVGPAGDGAVLINPLFEGRPTHALMCYTCFKDSQDVACWLLLRHIYGRRLLAIHDYALLFA